MAAWPAVSVTAGAAGMTWPTAKSSKYGPPISIGFSDTMTSTPYKESEW
jgi:hypothetical protein